MDRDNRAKARKTLQRRLSKRKGCIPRLSSDCNKGPCAPRIKFVKGYNVASGRFAGTARGQYCRKPR